MMPNYLFIDTNRREQKSSYRLSYGRLTFKAFFMLRPKNISVLLLCWTGASRWGPLPIPELGELGGGGQFVDKPV